MNHWYELPPGVRAAIDEEIGKSVITAPGAEVLSGSIPMVQDDGTVQYVAGVEVVEL